MSSKQKKQGAPKPSKAVPFEVRTPPKAVKVGVWEKMLVNPAESAMTRTPTTEPYAASMSRFQRTITYRPTAAGDSFAFALRPDILNTLHVMSSNTLTLEGESDANPLSYVVKTNLACFKKGTVGGSPAYQIKTASFIPARDPNLATYPITIGVADDDLTWIPITFESTVAACSIKVATTSLRPITVWATIAGVPTNIGVTVSSAILNYNVTLGIPIGPFSFSPVGAFSSDTNEDVVMYSNEASLWESQGNHYDLFSSQAADLVEQNISTYRVTAMSMLATYVGSSLENGGTIAAARVRPGVLPGLRNNVYSALSQLPDDRYVGALRDGAYVWWLPGTLDELNQREPFIDTPAETVCWVAGSFDDADASLQVTFDLVCEYYSPRQLFMAALGPALTDEWSRAYHALASVPAATCNPVHKELFKSIAKQGKRAVKGAAGAVLAHPDLAMALLSALL